MCGLDVDRNTINVKHVTRSKLSMSPLLNWQMVTANSKSHLVMSAVQNKMVPTPQGSFCMLVLLTGSRQDWVYVKSVYLYSNR